MKLKSQIHYLWLCLSALLFMGCPGPAPLTCKIGAPSKQPQAGTHPYFGQGATINVQEYNEIAMRPGDTVTLQFPCQVQAPEPMPTDLGLKMLGDKVQIWLPIAEAPSVARGGGTGAQSPLGPGSMTIVQFPNPQFQFMVHDASTQVWPGDANADGYRNMLDLLPIAYAIKNNRTQCCTAADPTAPCCAASFQSGMLTYPPQTTAGGEMDRLYTVTPWGNGRFVTWRNQNIDLMHADCNIDGKIDRLDAEYLMAVIDPMYEPEMLKSAVDGLQLKATYAPDPATPLMQLAPDGHAIITLPFEISFVNNGNQPVVDSTFFGVVFSRPVSQTTQYRLVNTQLRFDRSGVFAKNPNQTIWKQKFWNDFQIQYTDNPCVDAVDNVLDVGAFRLEGKGNPNYPSDRIGLCQVALDDILMPGHTGLPPSFQLVQHLIHGVVFTHNGNGQVVGNNVTCTTDDTIVDLAGICDKIDVIVRDGIDDDGVSQPTPEGRAWSSPDIWVEHQGQPGVANTTDAGHQQPVQGRDETVFVKVHNLSCKPVKAATVDVYWMEASLDARYGDFGHIGSRTVNIPAFGEVVVSLPWIPAFSRASGSVGCSPIVSLCAVIDAGPSDPRPSPTNGNLHDWVLDHNNVAVRSTILLKGDADENEGEVCANIVIPGLAASATTKQLWIKQIGGLLYVPASNYGKLQLDVSGTNASIIPNWPMQAGGTGSYYLEAGASAGSISLGLGAISAGNLKVSFIPNSAPGALPKLTQAQKFRFRIWVEEDTVPLNSSIVEFVVQ